MCKNITASCSKAKLCIAHSALVEVACKKYKHCANDTDINYDSNNFADADMQCDDLWQWELPHTQDEVAMEHPAPQNGEAARPVCSTQHMTRPASPPAAAAPTEVLPAAVAPVPPVRRERRLNASRPSGSRHDAVTSELVARLAAIAKDVQQKKKEHLLRMKLTRKDHELRMQLAHDEHNDRLQKREAEHSLVMENMKAKKALMELKMKLLQKENE